MLRVLSENARKVRRAALLSSLAESNAFPAGLPHESAQKRQTLIETLERRALLSVTIINGGGLGYRGNGGGGPPDVTGATGPNSYLQIDNSAVTLFSPKANRTILAADNINDFFFNPTIGNESLIYSQTTGIAPSPGGATEAGTTVTITTTVPHNLLVGESVSISGVGVAGYNGGFKITGTPTPTTFTYTAGTSGLAASGGGTVHSQSCGTCDSTGVFDNLMGADGRFIIGEIDIDASQNVGQYLFAVSKSSSPTTFSLSDWNFYHITTTEGSGGPSSTSWSDYPGNPGFNADSFVETFNMFGGGPNGCQVVSVKASDLAAGNPLVLSGGGQNVFRNDVPGGNQDYRPVTMHDSSPGDPMWLVHNPNSGTSIDVVKVSNILSNSPSFSSTSLSLPAADNFVVSGGIGNPLNPDNTPAIDGDDDSGTFTDDPENPGGGGSFDPGNRILKAGEWNNTIVAAHTVAVASGNYTLSSAQPNDKNGNPLGGTGYTVGDVLTLTGGTFTTAAQLKVTSVNGSGTITAVTVQTPGSYSNLSGVGGASGGTGTGAGFALFFTGELAAQWYAINVSGGTPAFQIVGGSPNVGRIAFGANTYAFEPGIDINSSGEIGMGFMESDTVGGAANAATGGFISTFVTARLPTDPAGTMQPVVLVPAGTGTQPINGRIGDFSGLSIDPNNGTFWATNEFGGALGPTVIANFTPETKPTVTPPADQVAVEGASKAFNLGSFSDPDGSPWKVDVAWGDGSSDSFTVASAGSLGTKTHTYVEEGSYTVTVKVTDNTLLSGSAMFNIAASDPAVIPTAVPVTAVEGQDTGSIPVATFTDPGGAESLSDYSAMINWGDGTPASAGTISVSAGVFTVSGDHTYAEESAADHPGSTPYDIKVTISHDVAPDAVVHTSAMVSDPAVTAVGGFTFNAVEGVPSAVQTVATFTDPGGAEVLGDYTAMIDWGDLTPPTPGTISFSAGVFTVTGSHTYATGLGLPADFGNTFCDAGVPSYHKAIGVTISHEAAPTALALSDAKITLPPASAHLAGGSLIVVGTTGDDKFNFTPAGSSGGVTVKLNNANLGTFSLGAGGRLIVAAMDGNDDIQVAGGVRLNTVLYGGPGNDRINGGNGQNIEVGCEGNDDLNGGNQHDLLIGGAGADNLNGGAGGDTMIGGLLLDAALAEDDKYVDVVNVLTSAASNPVMSAGLHAGDDGTSDTMQGASGADTFYYHFLGGGVFDVVHGKAELAFNT